MLGLVLSATGSAADQGARGAGSVFVHAGLRGVLSDVVCSATTAGDEVSVCMHRHLSAVLYSAGTASTAMPGHLSTGLLAVVHGNHFDDDGDHHDSPNSHQRHPADRG